MYKLTTDPYENRSNILTRQRQRRSQPICVRMILSRKYDKQICRGRIIGGRRWLNDEQIPECERCHTQYPEINMKQKAIEY